MAKQTRVAAQRHRSLPEHCLRTSGSQTPWRRKRPQQTRHSPSGEQRAHRRAVTVHATRARHSLRSPAAF
eukprot:2169528-Heterocapsa_arctica.AAC.1